MSDIAHLGHVELYTDRFEESLDFFTRVYGLTATEQVGDSAYLRAFDDYEHHSLKLTRHHTTGVGHIAYRASSAEALERRVATIEASGFETLGWVEGDAGHGRAFRFLSPFGHIFEIYWETERYVAPDAEKPALKEHRAAISRAGRKSATDRPLKPAGHRRGRVPALYGGLSGFAGDRDDPTGQRARRWLLVYR